MRCPRVSLPPWTTSTLNTQSGNSECSPLLNIHHLPHPHLNLRFTLFRVGQVVSIKSKVNRAFNSSMEVRDTPVTLAFTHSQQFSISAILASYPPGLEICLNMHPHIFTVFSTFNIFIQVGIQVSCEDLFSGHHWKVCHAYATFVTQRKELGERVRVHLILLLLKIW